MGKTKSAASTTINIDSGKVQTFAAGFNAHHQICEGDEDVSNFSLISSPSSRAYILFAGWSTTVLAGSEALFSLGAQRVEPRVVGGGGSAVNLRCGFGDHDGLMGCLDDEGRLYLTEPLDESPASGVAETSGFIHDRLSCRSAESSPLIGHLAHAQNGRIALTFKQAPNGQLCHLIEFRTFESFQQWFEDPAGEKNYPPSHQMLPGRPKQLAANTATFILLMESGQVYTWGDARYESLGRSLIGEDAVPAHRPGIMDSLGGLRISSVATGGWLGAALSEDGALYAWGATSPGSNGSIDCLDTAEHGAVALVDIAGKDSEPLDIKNVAVGDNHIVAIAGDQGRIFAVGDNRNGQLGLGTEHIFISDWQQVRDIRGAQSVFCGPKTSWAFVK